MKTKALISFAVTAKLICDFVFAYADCWFSHAAAQIIIISTSIKLTKPNNAGFGRLVYIMKSETDSMTPRYLYVMVHVKGKPIRPFVYIKLSHDSSSSIMKTILMILILATVAFAPDLKYIYNAISL